MTPPVPCARISDEGDDFIPRYVQYARSQGRTVEAQAAHDRESTLRMIPYMSWCRARLAEWWALFGRTERWPALPVMSAADHEAFDAWLAACVTAPDAARERGR